jgi:hypothetical protein
LVVAETARDQQARVLSSKPLPGDLLIAGFDGGRVIIDTNIPPRLQIADEGDATLQGTASDVKQHMVLTQPEMSSSLKLISLQLVPESKRSDHCLKLVASAPTRHKRPESVQLTAQLPQRALYLHHEGSGKEVCKSACI